MIQRKYAVQGLKLYIKDRVVLASLCISLLLGQLSAWVAWFKIDNLPSEIPLWYTVEPIDQLASVEYLWLLPGIATAVLVINTSLGLWLHRRYPAVSQMLAVTAAGVALLAMIATVKTVLIFTDVF